MTVSKLPSFRVRACEARYPLPPWGKVGWGFLSLPYGGNYRKVCLLDTGVRQYDGELSTVASVTVSKLPSFRVRACVARYPLPPWGKVGWGFLSPPYGGNERKGCLLDTGVRQYDEELSTVIPGPR